MNIKSRIMLLFCGLVQITYSQSPVTVTESTIKIPALSEEVFYYGFAEGDQLIFSFQEVKAKHPLPGQVEVFSPYITIKGRRVYPKNGKVFHFFAYPKKKG